MSNSKNLWNVRPAETNGAEARDAIVRVNMLINKARGGWLGLLSFLGFIGVTLMGVQDADFFIIERQTNLPLIGVSIPTSLFFYFAPALGAMLYIQMHIYLVKLWKALEDVPGSNDVPAAERIAPWIVSDMALAQRENGAHAYPLRSLSRLVAVLFTFLAAPLVLAGFWWRGMPKHDEWMTLIACGLPLFAVVFAGTESWLTLRRGGSSPRHLTQWTRGGWVALLLLITAIGFLTTEGTFSEYARKNEIRIAGKTIGFASVFERHVNKVKAELAKLDEAGLKLRLKGITDYPDSEDLDYLAERIVEQRWWMLTWWPELLRPAQLVDVVFVELPKGWLPRGEAEQQFRIQWCKEENIPVRACGKGPLVHDLVFFDMDDPKQLNHHRGLWCKKISEEENRPLACDVEFQFLDATYEKKWEKTRRNALAAIPQRNLRGVDLRRATLTGARFQGADLVGARMEGANLSWAWMEGADLGEARMERAVLNGTRLEGASLNRARMTGASLVDARMEEAYLLEARMEGAIFWNAQLRKTALGEARMEGAELAFAQMGGAHFILGVKDGVIVSKARLEGVYFAGTELPKILSGVSLKGAALRFNINVDFSQEQVNSSFGDESVTLPKGVQRPKHWPTWELPDSGEHKFEDEWRKWQADPEGYEPPPPPE